MKCKNCGAPIKWLALEGFEEPKGFWKHIRDVHAGSIWCYPNANNANKQFIWQAEPEETDA